MTLLLVFLFGISIGSFLNVIIDRLPSNKNPIFGRSYCDFCKKKLSWFDLIPLISFLILKAKCRFCKKKLSFYYPLVEVTTGVLFVLTFLRFQGNYIFMSFLFINMSFLIVTFFTDLKYGLILDKLLIPVTFISLLYLVFFNIFYLSNFIFSGILSFAFFMIIYLVTSQRGIGFGDVKLSFYMGLLLGFPSVVIAFYSAFLTGAIVSIILILCGKKKFFKDSIPFGPFLVIGAILSLFLSENILALVLPYL